MKLYFFSFLFLFALMGFLGVKPVFAQTQIPNAQPLIQNGAEDDSITPPLQPAKGPGSYDYAYTYSEGHRVGAGATGAVVFIPKGIMSEQGTLPVVVFVHGAGLTNPKAYGGWIDHIVRRRAIVIYPLYQGGYGGDSPALMTGNALAGVQAAYANLSKSGPFPDPDRLVIVGHSMGGVIALNLATQMKGAGLPLPRAVLSVDPGKTQALSRENLIPLEDLSSLPPGMLLVTMAGADDNMVGDRDARRLILDSVTIPADRKMMLLVPSDNHGSPVLSADHFAPLSLDADMDIAQAQRIDDDSVVHTDNTAMLQHQRMQAMIRQRMALRESHQRYGAGQLRHRPEQETSKAPEVGDLSRYKPSSAGIDALDWYGYWKSLDLLMAAAFGNQTIADLATNPALTDMGRWSDGTPVNKIQVVRAVGQ